MVVSISPCISLNFLKLQRKKGQPSSLWVRTFLIWHLFPYKHMPACSILTKRNNNIKYIYIYVVFSVDIWSDWIWWLRKHSVWAVKWLSEFFARKIGNYFKILTFWFRMKAFWIARFLWYMVFCSDVFSRPILLT